MNKYLKEAHYVTDQELVELSMLSFHNSLLLGTCHIPVNFPHDNDSLHHFGLNLFNEHKRLSTLKAKAFINNLQEEDFFQWLTHYQYAYQEAWIGLSCASPLVAKKIIESDIVSKEQLRIDEHLKSAGATPLSDVLYSHNLFPNFNTFGIKNVHEYNNYLKTSCYKLYTRFYRTINKPNFLYDHNIVLITATFAAYTEISSLYKAPKKH